MSLALILTAPICINSIIRVLYFWKFIEDTCLRILISLHANTQNGHTALMHAASKGHTECVRLLVEGGAIKDAKSNVRDLRQFSLYIFGFLSKVLFEFALL